MPAIRLDIAVSLLAAPPVVFLDEPTTGLDPRGRLALWQLLSDLTAGRGSYVSRGPLAGRS